MIIDDLLKYAVERNASDVHISVGIPPVIRVDGRLVRLNEFENLIPDDTIKFVDSIVTDGIKKALLEKGEIDFSYSVQGLGRFRVNVFKQRGSYAIAFRSIPLKVPTIEELGLNEVVTQLADLKRGLVLVTGPTGSGKSTTLAAMIDHINKTRDVHILTLEDPIEYLHKHDISVVNQREIGIDSDTYANALRAALRQDPDVILIGEMRDLETISVAVTAAETGHLVLSTLHTTGAVSTVDRIIDVFPTDQQQQIRIQLSAVLQGVLSQQLIKRSDKQGRVAAIEVLISNPAIKNHIREGKTHQIMTVMQTGKRQGMVSMDSAILELYRNQIITYEEAQDSAVDKESLTRML